MGIQVAPHLPTVRHRTLKTNFIGIQHALSTPDAPVHQYRGIKYASVPSRFRQSRLFTAYPPSTDATRFGPICPQPKGRPIEEELFGFAEDEYPMQNFKQIESECLNLNLTCPGRLTSESSLPVMLWIHGGGNRGSGSHWLYDGGALVQNSIRLGKPIILVTFNYRLGLLGGAASPKLLEDNALAGDEGVGNYGLRDQQRAMEWVHRFIKDFGGDPQNVTLFGASSGAADVLFQLVSHANATSPMFQRAIVQSPIIDCSVPDISLAGSHLSRTMAALHATTVPELRCVDATKLAHVQFAGRAVDDGVFFAPGWRELLFSTETNHHSTHHPPHAANSMPASHAVLERHLAELHAIPKAFHPTHHHPPAPAHSRSLPFVPRQPLIIGDCGFESALHLRAASLWTPTGIVRRLKAVCQSLSKASVLLRAYDISSYTPPDELPERVLDLINDARFAWPTDCVAVALRRARGGSVPSTTKTIGASTGNSGGSGGGVWRYVFDQEAPQRGTPHHAADLLYLFDTARPDFTALAPTPTTYTPPELEPAPDCELQFSADALDDAPFDAGAFAGMDADADAWDVPVVDAHMYVRVRDAVQGRWLAFAHGAAPWAEDRVYVFGPEGETGERCASIFEGRRRRALWKAALEPLGRELVHKVGVELSNGPVEERPTQAQWQAKF